jgi:hypothetical protein
LHTCNFNSRSHHSSKNKQPTHKNKQTNNLNTQNNTPSSKLQLSFLHNSIAKQLAKPRNQIPPFSLTIQKKQTENQITNSFPNFWELNGGSNDFFQGGSNHALDTMLE